MINKCRYVSLSSCKFKFDIYFYYKQNGGQMVAENDL